MDVPDARYARSGGAAIAPGTWRLYAAVSA